MNYYLKAYENDVDYMVAVCDIEVRGKTFVHNGVKININSKYYGDNKYSENEVLIELSKSSSINAFGNNICNMLIKNKLVHPDTVIWMGDDDEKIGHVIVLG